MKRTPKQTGILFFLLFAIALTLSFLSTSLASASDELLPRTDLADEPDSLTVLCRFWELLNLGKFDAGTELFADDINIIEPTGKTIIGKAPAREALSQVPWHKTELSDIWIKGDQIAWTVRSYLNDSWTLHRGWAVIQGGKIKTLTFVD